VRSGAIIVFHKVGIALMPHHHAVTAWPSSCTIMPRKLCCRNRPVGSA
jgi:hypothetical protein